MNEHQIRLWGPAWFLYPFLLVNVVLIIIGAITVGRWVL